MTTANTPANTKALREERMSAGDLADEVANRIAELRLLVQLRIEYGSKEVAELAVESKAADLLSQLQAELEAARGAALAKMLAEAYTAGAVGAHHAAAGTGWPETAEAYASRIIEQMKEQKP